MVGTLFCLHCKPVKWNWHGTLQTLEMNERVCRILDFGQWHLSSKYRMSVCLMVCLHLWLAASWDLHQALVSSEVSVPLLLCHEACSWLQGCAFNSASRFLMKFWCPRDRASRGVFCVTSVCSAVGLCLLPLLSSPFSRSGACSFTSWWSCS